MLKDATIKLVHDHYGRAYQAKAVRDFRDKTSLLYLYRYRNPHFLRCLACFRPENSYTEEEADMELDLILNQLPQIDLLETEGEILALFEPLSAVTLREFALSDSSEITVEKSRLYERLFDQIFTALSDFLSVSRLILQHRDISPDNLMITSEQDAILVDFGLSRVFLPGSNFLNVNKGESFILSTTPGYSSKLSLEEQAGTIETHAAVNFAPHPGDQESLARSFLAALTKKPALTLRATDIKSILAQVETGFAAKLFAALYASE